MHNTMTPEVAATYIRMGITVYRWCDYWGHWSEVLAITEGNHGILRWRERTLGETRIRDHSTQLGKRDRLTIRRPEGH
jgi:hypothetical protein